VLPPQESLENTSPSLKEREEAERAKRERSKKGEQ
jgi:hypothetical protein